MEFRSPLSGLSLFDRNDRFSQLCRCDKGLVPGLREPVMHRRRTGVLDRVPLFNHSIEISDDSGIVTCCDSRITGPEVTWENDAKVAAGGRGRWNNENETFSVLKVRGCNLKHNFGHGKQHLPTALAILNLPA